MADSEERKSPIIDTPANSDTEVDGGGAPVNEKKLLRKLDYNLLPAVGVLYLLSFLDRSNGKEDSNQKMPGRETKRLC